MREVTAVSEIINNVYELADKQYSFVRVARAIKLAVDDLNLYAKSMIAVKSNIVVVDANMTAILPKDCTAVVQVARLLNGQLWILDRARVIPNKESYRLQVQEFTPCQNCVCGASKATDPTTLPSAMESQWCSQATFFNFGNIPYLYAYYRENYGQFQEDAANRQILVSGVMIGDELLVQYRTTTNADNLAIVPKAAFDVLRYKALAYLEPSNMGYEKLYRSYKKRFDLNQVPQFSLDEYTQSQNRWRV